MNQTRGFRLNSKRQFLIVSFWCMFAAFVISCGPKTSEFAVDNPTAANSESGNSQSALSASLQVTASKFSDFSAQTPSFSYGTDRLYIKIVGAESGLLGCMEAYIPSRSQNDTHCQSNPSGWTQYTGAIMSQNPDWSYDGGTGSFTFLPTLLSGHRIFPNSFGRYKIYVKNRVQDAAVTTTFEIQPTAQPTPTPVPTGPIDTNNRNAVIEAFRDRYSKPEPDMGWTGNIANCVAGTTSVEYQQRVIDQISYFRNMVGLNSVTLAPNQAGNQQAALMMAANGQLSHSPPSTWKCYSASNSAGSSNLTLGVNGIGAINLYMDDWGDFNYHVGHRRWVLNPNTGIFGTGDVPGSNSLAVWLGGSGSGPAAGYVAWPSPGYFPAQVLPSGSNRWSFSLAGGGFGANTQVSMRNVTTGTNYTVVKEDQYYGFGNPTLVWKPQGFNSSISSDQRIRVTISNVDQGSGGTRDYTYDVILINAQ